MHRRKPHPHGGRRNHKVIKRVSAPYAHAYDVLVSNIPSVFGGDDFVSVSRECAINQSVARAFNRIASSLRMPFVATQRGRRGRSSANGAAERSSVLDIVTTRGEFVVRADEGFAVMWARLRKLFFVSSVGIPTFTLAVTRDGKVLGRSDTSWLRPFTPACAFAIE